MRGVVVRVDVPGKVATINAEKIDNWMDAMTMDYPVHDPAQLQGLAAGDHISATVHVKEDLSFWMDHVKK
jgi:Cu/Ag efflux protein CusF